MALALALGYNYLDASQASSMKGLAQHRLEKLSTFHIVPQGSTGETSGDSELL